MSFSNVTLLNSNSGGNGGFIYATGINPRLTISGACSFSGAKAEVSGGLAFFNGVGTSVISITNSDTDECYAETGSGGLLYLGNTF